MPPAAAVATPADRSAAVEIAQFLRLSASEVRAGNDFYLSLLTRL